MKEIGMDAETQHPFGPPGHPDSRDLIQLVHFLDRPRLRVGDMGISYRQVNYWEEKGLLLGGPERESEHAWRAFSLVDYYWIRMAASMREWGISFKVLKALRTEMEQAAHSLESRPEGTPRLLSLLLAEFIVTRLNLNLLIAKEGDFLLFNPANQDIYDESLRSFLDREHLSLSLAQIFRSTLLQHGIHHTLCQLPGLLSAGERALLQDITLGMTRWVKVVPLEQTMKEHHREGKAKDPELLSFIVTHLLGWPYERIDFQNEGGPPKALTWQEWSLRLEEEGGFPKASE